MSDRIPTDNPTQHLAAEDLPTLHWTPEVQDAPATQVASDGPPTEHVAFEDTPTSTVVPPAPEPSTQILSQRPATRRTRSKRLLVVIASGVLAGMLLATALRDRERAPEEPIAPTATQPAVTADGEPSDDASSANAPDPSAGTENAEVPASSSSSSGSSSGLRFPDRSSGTDVDGPSTPSQRRAPSGVDRSDMEDRIDRRL